MSELEAQPATRGLQTLRTGAGWAALPDRGWIAVTGEDRVRWLNGMLTNSVQALAPGEGSYSFLLNAQGRIQGDTMVWSEADRILLETDRSQVEPLLQLLDRFIIMDDVELADETAAWHGMLVAGPGAAAALQAAGVPARAGRLLKRSAVPWQGSSLLAIQAYSPAVPRFEIWAEDPAMLQALQEALALPNVPAESLELLRAIEATPRFGTDIRDKDLPQETAQSRALHFNKGCYLGQEIVERIRSRGQVHRTFAAFALHGGRPEAGAELVAEGKPVGVLTTVAAEPVDGVQLALGYVRREAIDRGLPLQYQTATATGSATVRAEAPDAKPASNA